MAWLFFQGCTSQNIYLGISLIIAFLLVFAIGITFTLVFKPAVPLMDIMKKYRWIIAIVLVIVFVVTFIINNTLFWYYCSTPRYWNGYRPYILWAMIAIVDLTIFGIALWTVYALMEIEVSKIFDT